MIKRSILVLLTLAITGCATGRWQPPISQADNFECDQKCGAYDPRQSIVFAGECKMACYRAKGYQFVIQK